MNTRLMREVEKYAKMEYPKVGVPLRTEYAITKKKRGVRFQPHVIDSGSTGKFTNTVLDTEEEAWEESIIICAEMKRNKKCPVNSNKK